MNKSPNAGLLPKLPYALPAVLMACAIFYVSSLSKIDLPLEQISFNDLIFHGAAYFFLGVTLMLAAFPWHRSFHPPWKTMLWLCAIGILYGLSDEIHQSFVPNRTCSTSDFLADASGILLAVCCVKILARRKAAGKGSERRS